MKKIICLFLFLVTAFSGGPSFGRLATTLFTWSKAVVDSSNVMEEYTSIVIDSSDKVHISYCVYSGTLKYATNRSGSWETEVVDSSGVGDTSIAVDSSDKIHIGYYDNTNRDLKCATGKAIAPRPSTIIRP